jgi:hypothetical protein
MTQPKPSKAANRPDDSYTVPGPRWLSTPLSGVEAKCASDLDPPIIFLIMMAHLDLAGASKGGLWDWTL